MLKSVKLIEGKRQAIVETARVGFDLLEADEAKKTGAKGNFLATIKGVGMEAGRITANDTLYTRRWVAAQMERIKERMVNAQGKGEVAGKADHSWGVLRNGCRWIKAELNGAWNVEVLGGLYDNDVGRNLQAQVDGGFIFDLSSVTYGTVTRKTMTPDHPDYGLNKDREGDEFWEIDDESELQGWDFVDDGSNEGAKTEDHAGLRAYRIEDYRSHLEDVMEIKDLAGLKAAVSAEVFEAIMKEAREGLLDAKAVQEKVDEAVGAAVKSALEDGAKVAEAAGLKPEVMAYAKEHSKALAKLAKDGKKPVAEDAPKPGMEEKVAQLEESQTKLLEQVAEADKRAKDEKKAREESERKLQAKLNRAELGKLVDEAVKGQTLHKLLAHDLRGDLDLLPEGFDADDAEKVKEAKAKIAEAVNARKKHYESLGVTGEERRPKGQGSTGTEGTDADSIVEGRKKFAEENPDFVPKTADNYQRYLRPVIDEGDSSLLADYVRLFGPEAQKQVPLS